MNSKPLILRYGHSRSARVTVSSAFWAITCVFWLEGIEAWPAMLAVALVVTAAGLLSGETQVVPDTAKVVRIWRVIGLITFWRREYSLTSFLGVQQRCTRSPDSSTWKVGLVDPFGRFLAVQWFFSGKIEGGCRRPQSTQVNCHRLRIFLSLRLTKLNHRSQRTPRFRSVCIPREWRGAAAPQRSV